MIAVSGEKDDSYYTDGDDEAEGRILGFFYFLVTCELEKVLYSCEILT